MEIADGIFTYRGRSGDKIKPGAGSSNVTIVRGDSLVMIDSGVTKGGAFEELCSRASADGLDPTEIELLLITHSHWDHINAAGVLTSRSGAKIAAPSEEIPFILNNKKNFDSFLLDFKDFAKEVFPYPFLLAHFLIWFAWGKQPRIAVDMEISGGEEIDVGRKIEAIPLPGHTTGQMGYFIRDAGVLVLGDLIDFENSQGMDLNNPRSDYESALKSLETAIALEPEIIIPGHGDLTKGKREVREVLEKALYGGRKYPELIRDALEKGPKRIKEITYNVFPDIPFSMEAMTMMLVLTVLLHMERNGDVKRSEINGRTAWVRGN